MIVAKIVNQPVYLITAELTLVGRPVPRTHYKLAYNRRRQDLNTMGKILSHLPLEYRKLHWECMPAHIDEHDVNVSPHAVLTMLEPKRFKQFRSAHLEHAWIVFNRPSQRAASNFAVRRVRVEFLAATIEEAKALHAWITRQNETWKTETIGRPVNHGLYSVVCVPENVAISMNVGKFLSVAETPSTPESSLTVQ